ncbi:galectin-3-like isoform X2 [Mercenaria mercenaria]|uniref:galectin-3-like isoform X2 n=1 Tax=Mercenaria mercenaria TaxID=6596 RepID=UPI00234E5F7F|nr:galectin-3-like isoform X2 [Mercenaria mercenaria]
MFSSVTNRRSEMLGSYRRRNGTRMEENKDIKIAATVLHVAGVTFGEVSNALKQHQRPVYGASKKRQSPVMRHDGALSYPSAGGVAEDNQFHGGRSGSGFLEYSPGQFHGGRSANGVTEYSQPVPYLENIGGLHPDKMIFISGVPLPHASRFSIYLQQGDNLDPQQIAMVFDVRFKWGNPVSNNCVVMNHKEGHWDDKLEERNTPSFPFRRGTEFQMIILVENRCFKIAVNDKHFTEFNHRVEPGRIDTLRIEGDVNVTKVRFQD